MKNITFSFLILLFLGGSISSCKVFQSFRYIKKKAISTKTRIIGDKEIIFVPIAHFSQESFYESLKDSIHIWKQQDFRIYYEEIQTDPDIIRIDTVELGLLKKKWRRINGGFGMTREDYEALKKIFKKGIAQPEWVELGATESDINADVSIKDVVEAYERRYGKVELSACDTETSLDEDYSCHPSLKNDLNPIILDFRNEHVVELIRENEDEKIVLVYGANHIKSMIRLLKAQY